MIRLENVVQKWGSADFRAVLKRDLESLDADQLPLQQALSQSSYVSSSGFSVMIINEGEQGGNIIAKAGIIYSGIIAGCSCADDPTPINEVSEYCEIEVIINLTTAETTVTLLTD